MFLACKTCQNYIWGINQNGAISEKIINLFLINIVVPRYFLTLFMRAEQYHKQFLSPRLLYVHSRRNFVDSNRNKPISY